MKMEGIQNFNSIGPLVSEILIFKLILICKFGNDPFIVKSILKIIIHVLKRIQKNFESIIGQIPLNRLRYRQIL